MSIREFRYKKTGHSYSNLLRLRFKVVGRTSDQIVSLFRGNDCDRIILSVLA